MKISRKPTPPPRPTAPRRPSKLVTAQQRAATDRWEVDPPIHLHASPLTSGNDDQVAVGGRVHVAGGKRRVPR